MWRRDLRAHRRTSIRIARSFRRLPGWLDSRARLGVYRRVRNGQTPPSFEVSNLTGERPMSESDIQKRVRLALGREPDCVVWRNNVGVAQFFSEQVQRVEY